MEVVETGATVLHQPRVGLVEADVLEATPFEEDLAGLDIQLLDDALPRQAIREAANGGEVRWYRAVDRDQGRVLRADVELVVVPVVAASGPDSGYLAVGAVGDYVLARELARRLHPGEHGAALVALDLEVHGATELHR